MFFWMESGVPSQTRAGPPRSNPRGGRGDRLPIRAHGPRACQLRCPSWSVRTTTRSSQGGNPTGGPGEFWALRWGERHRSAGAFGSGGRAAWDEEHGRRSPLRPVLIPSRYGIQLFHCRCTKKTTRGAKGEPMVSVLNPIFGGCHKSCGCQRRLVTPAC